MRTPAVRRFKLGFFVTTAMVLIIVAFYVVGKKQHLFGSAFRISGNFSDVSGLQVGNHVRFAGVNVGSVESVTITGKNAVHVGMLVSNEVRGFIRKDAEASIGSESMMGSKVVVIAPGSEEQAPIADRDVIKTAAPLSYDDLVKRLGRTSENAAVITENLAQLTSGIGAGQGALGKLFMDKQFAGDVTETMANLKKGSASFKELVDNAQQSWLLWGSGKDKDKDTKSKEPIIAPNQPIK